MVTHGTPARADRRDGDESRAASLVEGAWRSATGNGFVVALTLVGVLAILLLAVVSGLGSPSQDAEIVLPRVLVSLFILIGSGTVAFAVLVATGGLDKLRGWCQPADPN